MELLGRHYHAMSILGGLADHVADVDEVILARLAILAEGGDPADDAAVTDLLEQPLSQYMERVASTMHAMADGPELKYDAAHDAYRVGDHLVHQMRGYERRLMASIDDRSRQHGMLARMAHMAEDELGELPIGTYCRIIEGASFFIRAAIAAMETHTSTSS